MTAGAAVLVSVYFNHSCSNAMNDSVKDIYEHMHDGNMWMNRSDVPLQMASSGVALVEFLGK